MKAVVQGIIDQIAIKSAASLGTGNDTPQWRFSELRGRLTEISAWENPAALSSAMMLVREAQCVGEPTAWVGRASDTFFPLDAAAYGVDLAALIVVRLERISDAPRAADMLIRSGGFGLVVIDLSDTSPVSIPMPLLSRLVRLSHVSKVATICLTRKPAHTSSLGSLTSLYGRARRVWSSEGSPGIRIDVLKDKLHAPGWIHKEHRRVPVGMYLDSGFAAPTAVRRAS
jgi:recombination protein RecA